MISTNHLHPEDPPPCVPPAGSGRGVGGNPVALEGAGNTKGGGVRAAGGSILDREGDLCGGGGTSKN